nr:uncharacterized protein LOC109155364 [Ipomoea batatas]
MLGIVVLFWGNEGEPLSYPRTINQIASPEPEFSVDEELDNVDKIAELDWCGYLLQRLVNETREQLTIHLPSQMFYTDHLLVKDCIVPRNIPAFRGWTTKLLRERDFKDIRAGGFGRGTVDIPLRIGASSSTDQ